MPIIVTFDFSGSPPPLYNRVSSLFQRLGCEGLGGTAYRYPRLSAEDDSQPEDWFNHVIPALMAFRILANNSDATLTRYTIDV